MLRSVITAVITSVIATLLLSACAPATGSGDTTAGRLAAGDPQLDSGEYFETYTYAGQAGQLLTISLTSSDFDPYLIVLDPKGETLVEIDDSVGHGHDIVVSANLPVTGSYTVVVTSFEPGESGTFEIGFSTGPAAPTPAPEPTAPARQQDGAA